MSRLLKGEDCGTSESEGSGLPERFGGFAPLLGSGEANVGQRAVVQVAQVLTRASAFAPKGDGREEGRPHAKPPRLRRRTKEAMGVLGKRLGGERHLFLSLDTFVSCEK
jgi:hypothetical protein